PPAYVAYGLDTYMKLAFGVVERALPASLIRPMRWLQRVVERPVHGAIKRVLESQGFWVDGWVAGKSHFLLPCPPGATTLSIRGRRPALPHQVPVHLVAVADGIALSTRQVTPGADFEVSWPLPAAVREKDVIEVNVTCRPTFRHGRTPAGRDPRRLGF